jgi:glycosyltransferase involved in cell wall biosynthesis
LISNEENGYIIDPHDTLAVAATLRRFIEDPTLSSRMGQHSMEIMAKYTPEAAAEFLARVVKFVSQPQEQP